MTSSTVPAFAGHTYVFEFDNGTVFRNSCAADGRTLRWETLEGPGKGGAETVDLHVAEIASGAYFVGWVESTGITVTHLLDLNQGTVRAFWTYADANAKTGGRSAQLHTASLKPG